MSDAMGQSRAIRHEQHLQSTIKDPKNVQIMIRVIVECKGFGDNILLLAKCARVDIHQFLCVGVKCPHLNALIACARCNASCASGSGIRCKA
jgi:hypothetical protein